MRSKQYSKEGIKRVPCAGCGQPSTQQWQICSLNKMHLGICEKCDVDLNRVVLKFFNIRNWPYIVSNYKHGVKMSDSKIKDLTRR